MLYAYMPAKDIVKLYKEAKNKKQQVRILAELNLCTEYEIVEILKANGIPEKELKHPWARR